MAGPPPLDPLRSAILLVVVLSLFFLDMPGAAVLGLIVWAALMVLYFRRPGRSEDSIGEE